DLVLQSICRLPHCVSLLDEPDLGTDEACENVAHLGLPLIGFKHFTGFTRGVDTPSIRKVAKVLQCIALRLDYPLGILDLHPDCFKGRLELKIFWIAFAGEA